MYLLFAFALFAAALLVAPNATRTATVDFLSALVRILADLASAIGCGLVAVKTAVKQTGPVRFQEIHGRGTDPDQFEQAA